MDPSTRPAEWTVAMVSLVVAVAMFVTDHDIAALVAAVGIFLPPIITFIASRSPSLARLRPTEVGTAIVGVIGAVLLFMASRDVAALMAAMLAFVPMIITAFVGTDTGTVVVNDGT